MHEEFIFPPAADPRSPFRLHLAGSSYCDESYRIDKQKRDFYFVFEYIERGRGRLMINDMEYAPEAGDVYIVPNSGRCSYWSSADDPWVKHWFNVSGPLVAELLPAGQFERLQDVISVERTLPARRNLEIFQQTPDLRRRLKPGDERIESMMSREFPIDLANIFRFNQSERAVFSFIYHIDFLGFSVGEYEKAVA